MDFVNLCKYTIFTILRYIMGVHCWGVSVKWDSTVWYVHANLCMVWHLYSVLWTLSTCVSTILIPQLNIMAIFHQYLSAAISKASTQQSAKSSWEYNDFKYYMYKLVDEFLQWMFNYCCLYHWLLKANKHGVRTGGKLEILGLKHHSIVHEMKVV